MMSHDGTPQELSGASKTIKQLFKTRMLDVFADSWSLSSRKADKTLLFSSVFALRLKRCKHRQCRPPLLVQPAKSGSMRFPLVVLLDFGCLRFAETAEFWYKVSMVGTAVAIAPVSLYMIYVEANHEHHAKANYEHMQIRTKPFPWGNGKCDLLDSHCESGHH
jgi:hypothetical protein